MWNILLGLYCSHDLTPGRSVFLGIPRRLRPDLGITAASFSDNADSRRGCADYHISDIADPVHPSSETAFPPAAAQN